MGNACCSEADKGASLKIDVKAGGDGADAGSSEHAPGMGQKNRRGSVNTNATINAHNFIETLPSHAILHPQAQYAERKSDKSGSMYKGQMLNGKRQGHGRCEYDHGAEGPSVYEGQWLGDKCHGHGRFRDDESEYIGEWRMGQKHGMGEERWFEDGTMYRGEHVEGKKHGKGKYVWEDGSSYEGDFNNDVVEGRGVFKDAEGVYTGQFLDNMQHGEGKLVGEGGITYEGQFFETLKHGEGTMTWPDGLQYVGQWKNGVQHGTGWNVDTRTGEREHVTFKNGERV